MTTRFRTILRKSLASLGIAVFAVSLIAPQMALAAYTASDVLGQTDFTTGTPNTATLPIPNQYGMNYPAGSIVDSVTHRLFVADSQNNRVLEYDLDLNDELIDHAADAVLGQPDFESNDSGLSASSLDSPTGLAVRGNDLYVADSANNRVLVFEITAITNGENAYAVLGQTDFTSNGAATSAAGMSNPRGLAYGSTNVSVFVADTGNNRVIGFGLGPVTTGQAANVLLGQSNFTSNGCATTQDGLCGPEGLTFENSISPRLFVSDTGNNRVMVFDAVFPGQGDSAINVLGESSFTTTNSSPYDWTTSLDADLYSITALLFDPTNEVLYAGGATGTFGETATLYRCDTANGCDEETDWTISLDPPDVNIGGITMDTANGVIYVGAGNGNVIYHCDTATDCDDTGDWTVSLDVSGIGTFDSLAFDSTNGAIYAAGGFTGEVYKCLTSSGCDAPGDWTNSSTGTSGVTSLAFDSVNDILYAGTGTAAIIQRCVTSGAASPCIWTGSLDAPGFYINGLLFDPVNAVLYAGQSNDGLLYRCDTTTACDDSADWTLSFDTPNLGVYSFAFDPVNNVIYAGSFLDDIIYKCETSSGCDGAADWKTSNNGDETNHNSMAFDSVHGIVYAGTYPNALVIRCDTATGCLAHTRFDAPRGLAYDIGANRLFVHDGNNNRVLVFDVNAITNGEEPVNVLGQPDFTTTTANTTQDGLSFGDDADMWYDYQGHLYVSDTGNNRVMIFDAIAITDGEPAVDVVGQVDANGDPVFTTGSADNQDNPSVAAVTANGMDGPQDTVVDTINHRLFVADTGNNRVLEYDLDANNDLLDHTADSVLGQPDFESDIAAEAGWTTSFDTPEVITFSPTADTANNVIYAGSYVGGIIYRCDATTDCDEAGDWTTSFDTPQQTVEVIAFDSINNILYVATAGPFSAVIYRCDTVTGCDTAGDWTTSFSAPGDARTVFFDSSNGIIYAAATGGVIIRCDTTTDCDVTGDWTTSFDTPESAVYAFTADTSNGVIYAGADGIIYRCDTTTNCDTAGDWTTSFDTTPSSIRAFAFDPANDILYAATSSATDGFIYRCDTTTNCDTAGDWTTSFITPDFSVDSLTIDTANSVIYGGVTFGRIVRCDTTTNCDTAGDWSTSFNSGEQIIHLGFDPTNEILYAGSQANGIIFRCDTSTGCDGIPPSAANMNNPQGLAYDAGDNRLFVSDTGDNRVLVFDTASITNGEAAVNVLGQATFTTADPATTQTGLDGPTGLTYDSPNSRLFVADTDNNRVMVFDTAVIVDGEPAVNVVGPSDFTSTSGGSWSTTDDWTVGFAGADSFSVSSLALDSGNGVIYAGTAGNGLIYRCDILSGCDAPGDWALSIDTPEIQIYTLLYESTTGTIYAGTYTDGLIYRCDTATGCDDSGDWTVSFNTLEDSILAFAFDSIHGVVYAGGGGAVTTGTIYRCDITTDCDAPSDWTTSRVVPGDSIYSMTFDTANGVLYAGNNSIGSAVIYRCDTATDCDATSDWTTSLASSEDTINVFTIDEPNGVLYVGTIPNGLIYRCDMATSCDGSGDWTTVLDTPDFSVYALAFDSVQGDIYAGTAASSLIYKCDTTTGCNAPGDWALAFDIDDGDAQFIYALLFEPVNSVLYAGTATLGDLLRCATATGCDDTGGAALPLDGPTGVAYDSSNERLFLADSGNNRVVTFDAPVAMTDGEAPTGVLGQPDLSSNGCATTQSGLCFPTGLSYDSENGQLFVGDTDNNRVMLFEVASVTDGENAVGVLGQDDFTSNGAATSMEGLDAPHGLSYDPTTNRLYIADTDNNRVIIDDFVRITSAAMPDGTVDEAYSETVPTEDEQGTRNFSIVSGSLPPGLSLDSGSGEISGIPTTAGSYAFTVLVEDDNGSWGIFVDRQAMTMDIAPASGGGGGGGGGGGPIITPTPSGSPTPNPSATPAPLAGYIIIDDYAAVTKDRFVKLSFKHPFTDDQGVSMRVVNGDQLASNDRDVVAANTARQQESGANPTPTVAPNTPEMSSGQVRPFTPELQGWDLCAGTTVCRPGQYNVFVQYYKAASAPPTVLAGMAGDETSYIYTDDIAYIPPAVLPTFPPPPAPAKTPTPAPSTPTPTPTLSPTPSASATPSSTPVGLPSAGPTPSTPFSLQSLGLSPATISAIGEAVTAAAPVLVVLAVAPLAIALATALAAGNAVAFTMFTAQALLEVFGLKRRPRVWGTVYDAKTKRPIAYAKVELRDQANRVLETRYTDHDGRYGFLITPASLQQQSLRIAIAPSARNYSFPSALVTGDPDYIVYDHVYRGGEIVISRDELVNYNIPLDPGVPASAVGRPWSYASSLVDGILNAAFWIGLVVLPLNAFFHPSLFTVGMLLLFIVANAVRLGTGFHRPYGIVRDERSGTAMPYSLVTLNDPSGKRIAFSVSDDRGRYILLAKPGSYLVTAHAPAQAQPQREKTTAVTTKKGWVTDTVNT